MWGLATVSGTFGEFSGSGQVGDGTVTGRLDIRAASLRTGIGARDRHLRSADFFDVEHHPDITVEVTAAEPAGDGGARLHAHLHVRGTTLPVELPATVTRLGDGAVQICTELPVDRSAFGVSGNMLGMMGPTTTVSADLVFTRVAD